LANLHYFVQRGVGAIFSFPGRIVVFSTKAFFMKSIFVSFLLVIFSVYPTGHVAAQPDSLDIKIGQMIIFGFYGTAIKQNDLVYKAVKEGKIGSILIYRRNIASSNTSIRLKKLVDDFQAAAVIPLFISIDQEGGLVNRFDSIPGFPPMPSALFLGGKNDTAVTTNYSNNIATTLVAAGINLNYAPVLDLHNPACPVIGARRRAFSANPVIVAQQAGQVIKSHNTYQVHTIVKHFPGHGNSTTDSHFGITDVTKTWKKEELDPYRLLIKAGLVEAVMTAHIVNKKLDPSGLPATLSKKIINGLLRDSLGFDGPVFSDDMMMQAISTQYGVEESIFLALQAGVDVLMFSNNIKGVVKYSPEYIHKAIKTLVIKGKISPFQINRSYQRIMKMKQRWSPAS
jgi:beta-N-acetylhexosaminidase